MGFIQPRFPPLGKQAVVFAHLIGAVRFAVAFEPFVALALPLLHAVVRHGVLRAPCDEVADAALTPMREIAAVRGKDIGLGIEEDVAGEFVGWSYARRGRRGIRRRGRRRHTLKALLQLGDRAVLQFARLPEIAPALCLFQLRACAFEFFLRLA